MSETAKHRAMVVDFCQGNGIDLGSAGDPVVPWAISHDLPSEVYRQYNSQRPDDNIQWRGSAWDLSAFNDGAFDFLHASHLLEDAEDWVPVLREWDRVLKPGGFMIIAVPDHARFRAAVAAGQGDNLSHRHESHVGELTSYLGLWYDVLRDDFVSDSPHEYSILFIGRKRKPGEP